MRTLLIFAAIRSRTDADFYGTPINFSLELEQDGELLSGEFDGDKLEGTVSGRTVHFLAKDEPGTGRASHSLAA